MAADNGTLSKLIYELLSKFKVIAVVGLSPDTYRPSHSVANYMKSNGYRIIQVNPNVTEVLGEKSYPRLLYVPESVDIVNIFRKSPEAGAHVDEAIRIGARAVWLQEGIIDYEAADRARGAGLHVLMDRCLYREHLRLNS